MKNFSNGNPELRCGESGNGRPELRFGEIIRTFLAASFILFFISACFPSAEKIEQNIAKLKSAGEQHQQILAQELDANSDNATIVPETKPRSLVTLEEGDVSPSWVSELPLECGNQVYCGLAFVEHCKNANSCRDEAETKARNDLRKQISVKLRSITSSRTYAELSAESAEGHKTFQSEIRERAANIELKNVRFTHFYLRPENNCKPWRAWNVRKKRKQKRNRLK